MAKQDSKATALAEAKNELQTTATAPVNRSDAARVIELARDIFLRRMTGMGAESKTAAFHAGRAFDDAQTFWDEVDTRN